MIHRLTEDVFVSAAGTKVELMAEMDRGAHPGETTLVAGNGGLRFSHIEL